MGELIVRIVRERGQEFVDVASVADPTWYYNLVDIGIAQGWRHIGAIEAQSEPAPLAEQLNEVSLHRAELEGALAPQRLAATRAAFEAACKRRSDAWLEKLSKLADEADAKR